MASICKVEKIIRSDSELRPIAHGSNLQYPKRLVWAVLDDEGKTIFETEGAQDSHFQECLRFRDKNALQITRCLTCED